MTTSEIDEYYTNSLKTFTETLERAISTSYASTGLECGERRYWASILFTRICTFSISILFISPGSKVSSGIHWDFGAIAALARNVFECALTFFYLGIEEVTDDEWKVRLKVMQLHDCTARIRMSRNLIKSDSETGKFEETANQLRGELETNQFFVTLPVTLQKKLLKGERSCIHIQDEIITRMGEDVEFVRGYYHFLSSHTHSYPLGFYRMAEHGRGHGGENKTDKCYIASALEFSTDLLKRCTDDMQTAFSDVATFSNSPFNWDALLVKCTAQQRRRH